MGFWLLHLLPQLSLSTNSCNNFPSLAFKDLIAFCSISNCVWGERVVTLLAEDIDIMGLLMPASYLSNVSSHRVQLEPTHTHLGRWIPGVPFFGSLFFLLPLIETVFNFWNGASLQIYAHIYTQGKAGNICTTIQVSFCTNQSVQWGRPEEP